MPEEEVGEAQGEDAGNDDGGEDGRLKVWTENERALNAFLAVCRLWCRGPMGEALFLDRPNVKAELRMRKIKVDAALLDDLAAIEGGAIEVMNAK